MKIKPVSGVTEPTLVAPEEAPNTTALQLFGSANLFSVEAPRDTANLFTQAKVPYPIEMGEVFKGEHVNKLCLFDGKTATAVPVPYIMTVIAAKPASREETKDAAGKVKYVRAFAGGSTNAQHIDFTEKSRAKVPGYIDGNSYIIAIISDAGIVVAELAAFKTQKDYWGKPLYQARVQQGAGVQVLIADHGANTTVSKAGMKYLDPKKFTQVKPVELTREQLEAISAVFESQKAKFEAWMKQ
jgi:hypothetical protein